MKPKRQITPSDIVIVSIIMLLFLANLAAVGTAGRERAKRAVCLSNLKQLTQAWRIFADDHNGQLINGMAGIDRPDAKAWVGQCWHSNYSSGKLLPATLQREAIEEGALWPYLEALNLYRCPSGYPGELLNYRIVDAMNGLSRSGTVTVRVGVRIDDTVLWVQNLSEIITPGPAERMVFLDAGYIAPDSFSTHYAYEAWWDTPPVRHNDGTTVSFADGHVEYWPWQGTDTIEYGRTNDRVHLSNNYRPQTPEGFADLHRFQRAVWGRLGYEPTEE